MAVRKSGFFGKFRSSSGAELYQKSTRRTALYTYLNSNLKSARMRRKLEEGAIEHEQERGPADVRRA